MLKGPRQCRGLSFRLELAAGKLQLKKKLANPSGNSLWKIGRTHDESGETLAFQHFVGLERIDTEFGKTPQPEPVSLNGNIKDAASPQNPVIQSFKWITFVGK